MRNEQLKEFINSGRTIISDTKTPRQIKPKERAKPDEIGDPHKMFVRQTIQTKPKKLELVEEFKKFIKLEEAKL
jgi:hypothetical protein